MAGVGTMSKVECVLFSAVTDAERALLEERLTGMGGVSGPLNEHEVSCCLFQNLGKKPSAKTGGPGDIVLRLRCTLDDSSLAIANVWSRPWSILHYYANEADRKRPSTVRGMLTVDIGHGSALDMAMQLGFAPSYEFVRRGVRFVVRNRYVVSIFRVTQLERPHDIASEVPLKDARADHSLVELSVVCVPDEINDASDDLRAFAGHFVGLVNFYHPDYATIVQYR